MKRKLLATVLSVAMVATVFTGCGSAKTDAPADDAAATDDAATDDTADDTADDAATDDAAATGEGGLIGVAMPTKDLQRWNQDGTNMKSELEAAGYDVDLQFASNDIATQVSQVENMINNGCQVLVIASIDGDSLGTVLAQAKEKNIDR